LGHVYTLDDGTPLRLRLARSSDAPAVRSLLEACGQDGADLKAARLVHFDPRRDYVVCATGLINATETLLGIGAITLDDDAQPELLLVADVCAGQLRGLLEDALVASARGRSRAA
jgi:hypothetical protein